MEDRNTDVIDLLRDLNNTIKNNRQEITEQIKEVYTKADEVRPLLDAFKREILSLYVTRAEYDPKHQIILDKINRYDNLIDRSVERTKDIATMQSDINNLRADIQELKARPGKTGSIVVAWISIGVAILSLLATLSGHIGIH